MAKKRINLIDIEHLSTNVNIKQHCAGCPMSIYHKDGDNVMLGVGNIESGIILILPPYDFNAKIGYNTILNILIDVYRELTGNELLEEFYITRSIKCVNKTSFDIYQSTYAHCYKYLYYEFSKLKVHKVVCFDKHYYDIIPNSYNVLNPAVMYYDNVELQKKFKNQLTEALCYDS